MPERNEKRPRRTDPLSHFTEELNGNSRDALSLKFGCHQAHGLVAHWSDRHQQCDIHAILDQSANRSRSGVSHQTPWRRERAHEREVAPIH